MIPSIFGSIYALLRALFIFTGYLLVIAILIPIGMMLVGYRVNADSKELAQEAVKKGNPELCANIINYGLLGPSTGESRSHCVYTYAKISKDPIACELLMPSPYGWSCLGAAKEEGDACDINYGRDVSWWMDSVYEKPRIATMKECKEGIEKSEKGRNCCYILQVTSEMNVNDCSRFQGNDPFMNLCLSQLALKKKSPDLCQRINNENKRTICQLQAKYNK